MSVRLMIMVFACSVAPLWAAAQATPAAALAPEAGDGARGQYNPALAFGKDGYLAVWREGLENRHGRIFFTRVDKSGRALDPNGIALAGDLGFQHEAAVAYGGGCFLVVFSALKAQKGADGFLQSGVFGVRVSPEGKVLDAKPFSIGAALGHQAQPAVAFDGANFRVVWVALLDSDTTVNDVFGLQLKGLLEIRASRVAPSGQVLDGGPGVQTVRGPAASMWQGFGMPFHPKVATAGGKVTVAFCSGGAYPQAVLFDASLPGPPEKAELVDLPQVVRKIGRLEGRNIRPALAASAAGFAASWSVGRERGWNGPPWIAMVFDPAGKPCDAGGKGVELAPGADSPPCIDPALAFDGEAYVHVWLDHAAQILYAARFAQDGKRLDPANLVLEQMGKNTTGRPLSRDFDAPALASDGQGSTLCLYQRYPTAAAGRVEIVGRFIRK